MEIFGYVIMPSHVHLIFRSALNDPSGLIRDFKGFTAIKILRTIFDKPQESRKECLMPLFLTAGERNSNVKSMQFWQQNNQPIEIWSLQVFEQKLNYIHRNPVLSGFVVDPIEWKYSSARNYANADQSILEIDVN